MDDNTSTTDTASDQPSGGNQPLPESGADHSADTSNQDTTQDDTSDADDSSSDSSTSADQQSNDDLAKFAKAQGFDPENLTDGERRALKLAHDNQRSFHQARESESQVRKQIQENLKSEETETTDDDGDPLERQVNDLQKRLDREALDRRVTEFYLRNPEAQQYDKEMAILLRAKPYLAQDFESLLLLAKARASDGSLDAAKDAGRKEERELLAKKSRAGGTSPNASSSAPSGTKGFTREQIANMSDDEYTRNRPAILEAERAGLIK